MFSAEKKFEWWSRWHTITSTITRPLRKMKRIIEYIPVIWENEDWDYAWIYELLEYKLKRVEKAHRGDDLHLNADRHADEVLRCRIALKRLRENTYTDWIYEEMDEYFKPVGDMKDLLKLSKKRFRTYEAHNKEYRRYLDRINKHEDYMRNQDLDYFWKIFKKHHQSWWI